MLRWGLSLVLLHCASFLVAEIDPPRVHTAVRLSSKISIDGNLDEGVWDQLASASDFIQWEPNPGEKASFDTHVKIAYDDAAIYVGALMKDPEPSAILRQLSTRDQRENSSWFGIAIDPYQNAQLGFAFNVTSAGVQQDMLLTDSGEDLAWNAVWESAVKITDEGWTAELRIPFSAIRFPQADIQNWGLQIAREIRRKRESTFWNAVSPTVNGFMTQFGQLEGLNDIEPPIRLSFTPFLITYADVSSPEDAGSSSDLYYSAGMDLKYGINDAFTLDMTLVPDFGQAQSDNNVLNLSPFEVFFTENRQFFTEGIELFDKGGLFYSRRIGASPINRRSANLDLKDGETIVKDPSVSKLYNASKLSGRTSKGLGVGLLNAIGAPTDVIIEDEDGNSRAINVSPLSNYNVLVFDQSLRANSSITFTNTNVWRSGNTYDANVSGLKWDIKNLKQSYGIRGQVNISQRYDTSTDIGYRYNLELAKISGNLTAFAFYGVESRTYNPNDLGFLFSPNEQSASGGWTYNQYNPKIERIQLYRFGMRSNYNRLYDPNEFVSFNTNINGFVLLKSRDAFGGEIDVNPFTGYNYFEPRTLDFSARLAVPKNIEFTSFISSDYRKTLAIDARVFYQKFQGNGRHNFTLRVAPRIRFNDKLFVTIENIYNKFRAEPGFVNKNLSSDFENTPNDFILIGRRNRDRIQNIFNINYTFNEVMSLSTRIRHYWDRVEYQEFGSLKEDGFLTPTDFEGFNEAGNPIFDRNINLLNIDMVYTWRFAPGSDISMVWKNQISQSDQAYDHNYFENVGSLSDADQFDSFSFKLIYYLDYLYLKR